MNQTDDSARKNFKAKQSLLLKITGLVVVLLILTDACAIGMLYISGRSLNDVFVHQSKDTFSQVFSSIDDIFSTFEKTARANITKVSGLISLRKLQRAAESGFKAFTKETSGVIDDFQNAAAEVYREDMTNLKTDLIAWIDDDMRQIQALSSLAADTQEAERESFVQAFNTYRDQQIKRKDELDRKILATQDRTKEKISQLTKSSIDRIDGINQEKIQAINDSNKKEAKIAMEYIGSAGRTLIGDKEAVMSRMDRLQQDSLKKLGETTTLAMRKNLLRIGMVLPAMAIVFIFISILIGYSITRNIRALVKLVSRMEGGDLNQSMDMKTDDEIGELFFFFNQFALRLRTTLKQTLALNTTVNDSAGNISMEADNANIIVDTMTRKVNEISEGAVLQENRLQEVAQSLEDLASNLSGLSSDVSDEPSSAGTASFASSAGLMPTESIITNDTDNKDLMQRISFIVNSTSSSTKALAELKKKSEKITEILEKIAFISDQTSLLSINASIEAARAGEHGRGFAIVADEVRKLSVGSSDASKEISTLIENVQQGINDSAKQIIRERNIMVNEMANILHNLLIPIRETSDIAREHTALTNATSDEMRAIVSSMEKMNEQAHLLKQKAASLSEAISFFKID